VDDRNGDDPDCQLPQHVHQTRLHWKAFPGIKAAILGPEGDDLPPLTLGELAIQKDWPAMMKQIWRDEKRYDQYFSYGSWFVTGDTAYVDDDGYFYFQGRDDDLVKIAGVVVSLRKWRTFFVSTRRWWTRGSSRSPIL